MNDNNDGFIPVPENYKVKLGDAFRCGIGGETKIIRIENGLCFGKNSTPSGFCRVDFGNYEGWYYKPARKQIYIRVED